MDATALLVRSGTLVRKITLPPTKARQNPLKDKKKNNKVKLKEFYNSSDESEASSKKQFIRKNTQTSKSTELTVELDSSERMDCSNTDESENVESGEQEEYSHANNNIVNKIKSSERTQCEEVEKSGDIESMEDTNMPEIIKQKILIVDKKKTRKVQDTNLENAVTTGSSIDKQTVEEGEESIIIKQEPEEYFSDEDKVVAKPERKKKYSTTREPRISKRAKMVTSEIENVYAKPRMIFTGRGVVRKFEPGLDRTPKSRRGRKPGKATTMPPVKIKQEPKEVEAPMREPEEDGAELDQLQRALSEAAENIGDVGEEFFDAFSEIGDDPKKSGRPKRRNNALFKRVEGEGDKYVECTMCFKMLKESSMKQHFKTHTGEKPHACNECEARFTRKGDVERHKRLVHKNQKPYKCQKCNKEFSDLKNLKAHLQNHDKAIYYACNTCGFKFGKREYYENHIRYIHPLPDGTIPAFTDTGEDLATRQLKQIEMEEKQELKAHKLALAAASGLVHQLEEDASKENDKPTEITISENKEPGADPTSSIVIKKENDTEDPTECHVETLESNNTSHTVDNVNELATVTTVTEASSVPHYPTTIPLIMSKPEVGTDVKISKGTLSFTQTVPDTDSQDEDLVNKVIAAAVSQATNTIESLQAKSGGNMSGNMDDLIDDEDEDEDDMLEEPDDIEEMLDTTNCDILPIPQVPKQQQQQQPPPPPPPSLPPPPPPPTPATEIHINASVSGQQRKFIIQVPPGTNLNVQTPEGMDMIVSIVNQLCAGKGELDGPIEVTMLNPSNSSMMKKK